MRNAIFFDRDGVLNQSHIVDGKPFPPRALEQLIIVPEAKQQLDRVRIDFELIVVTNQPDVSKGLMTWDDQNAINEKLSSELQLDEIVVCAHQTADNCVCRKPKAGMILDAAARHDVDLSNSWMVGDRWVDIAAGCNAGIKTVLLERHYSWLPTSSGDAPDDLAPDFKAPDLTGCIDIITSS